MIHEISKKDKQLISSVRKNSRAKLVQISKSTGIPVSSIFNWINKNNSIARYTGLINFANIGYNIRVFLILKTGEKDNVEKHLNSVDTVNSLFRINNGFDFLLEGIFNSLAEYEIFLETLENKYKITKKQSFYTINEIKRENFMVECI